MTFQRKIRYQADYLKRFVLNVYRGSGMPEWLTGRAARSVYLALLVILVVSYICQICVAAGSGYQMRDLSNKVNTLREEIQRLNVDVATLNALPNLEKRLGGLGMSKAENITYLSAADLSVAKK